MSSVLAAAVEDAIAEKERRSRTDNYFNDPVAWAKYMLDVDLWSKQREISMALVEHKNVAVKAGHGVGKSFLVAVLACWWIDTRYPHAMVASTAPSVQQIGAIVWKEIRRMKNEISKRYKEGLIDHQLPGKINSDNKNNEWKDDSGVPIGFGKKPPENKEDDSFQGIHDGYVLAIGDEACGLSAELIDSLSNITSNEGSRRILIANPTNPLSYFASLFKQDKGFSLHTISVFDSPNFTDEKYEMTEKALASLSGPTYAEDKAKEYGIDSARYKARVLGEFSFDVGATLISQNDISVGFDAEYIPSTESKPELGVDVARFGDDKTVVYTYQDGHLRFERSWGKTSLMETAARVDKIARDLGVGVVKIDSVGVGAGAAEELVRLAGDTYMVVELYSSRPSPDKKRWYNVRAYWWDNFRERLSQGFIDLDDTDETLMDELMSVEYKFAPTGGLLIESKDDMKKRGQKSPDHADAAIYAAADISFLLEDPLVQAGLEVGDQVLYQDEFIGQRDFIGF